MLFPRNQCILNLGLFFVLWLYILLPAGMASKRSRSGFIWVHISLVGSPILACLLLLALGGAPRSVALHESKYGAGVKLRKLVSPDSDADVNVIAEVQFFTAAVVVLVGFVGELFFGVQGFLQSAAGGGLAIVVAWSALVLQKTSYLAVLASIHQYAANVDRATLRQSVEMASSVAERDKLLPLLGKAEAISRERNATAREVSESCSRLFRVNASVAACAG